ncbi:hypothetical protein IWQ57_002277 [Coemansia nantahalensis]|uniref:Uncharacterized protein n=1 Tax=Coemansia nantahalensis TaxID=2789366 RepID=A0ACC1K1A8_9FUNG|nr:hypothetical protein IWQ57_002277 [Coemansia nantahalensis]
MSYRAGWPASFQYILSGDYRYNACRVTSPDPLSVSYLCDVAVRRLGSGYKDTRPMLIARGKRPETAHVADYHRPPTEKINQPEFANAFGQLLYSNRVEEVWAYNLAFRRFLPPP